MLKDTRDAEIARLKRLLAKASEKAKVDYAGLEAVKADRDRLAAENARLRSGEPTEYALHHENVELRADIARLREAATALGVMPDGICFCSKNQRSGTSGWHEPECRNLRAALGEAES